MKKVLISLAVAAVFAVSAFAEGNVENPLYGPASLGFYSKTGFGWMNKHSDNNLAMKAKDWVEETENPVIRIYEDFGFGITDWLAIRAAFGYTHDGDIDRKGPHNARAGLNFRPINSPKETVTWDVWVDAWLGGVADMKADLVMSKTKDMAIFMEQPLSFDYKNYGNGRWGVWFGTQVGKTFDKFTVAVFGDVQKTFNSDNSEITIKDNAKPVIQGMVKKGVISSTCDQVAEATGGQVPAEACKSNPSAIPLANYGGASVDAVATQVSTAYMAGVPETFSVETKGTWDFAAGLKTLYEINDKWSIGGGFDWRHRATNSVEKVKLDVGGQLDKDTKDLITGNVAGTFEGPMDDGVDEFKFTLLGSRQLTSNLGLTLYGEYTFDTAEEKAQLGTTMKAEAGLRFNCQF